MKALKSQKSTHGFHLELLKKSNIYHDDCIRENCINLDNCNRIHLKACDGEKATPSQSKMDDYPLIFLLKASAISVATTLASFGFP